MRQGLPRFDASITVDALVVEYDEACIPEQGELSYICVSARAAMPPSLSFNEIIESYFDSDSDSNSEPEWEYVGSCYSSMLTIAPFGSKP